jgi:HAMP domain-containing protein
MAKKSFRLDLRTKLTVIMTLMTVIPIIIVAYLTFIQSSNFFKENILDTLEGLADIKSQAIEGFIKDRVNEVEGIATLPSVVSNTVLLMTRLDVKTGAEKAAKPIAAEGEAATGTGNMVKPPETAETELVVQDIVTELPAAAETLASGGKIAEDSIARQVKDIQASQEYQELNETLGLISSGKEKFEELLVIDTAGIVRTSTHYEHEGKSAVHNDYFTNGMKATYIQDVYVSGLTGKLSMVISTPIKNEIGKSVGVLAARLNLKTFHKLIHTDKGLGTTGETLVGKKIDEEVVLMAPTRFDDNAALSRKIAIGSKQGFDIQEAARDRQGSGLSRDYRDVEVYSAWRHIPSLKWGLVTKMDGSEAQKPIISMKKHILVLVLCLVGVTVFLSAFIARGIVHPLRELKEAAESISRGHMDVKVTIKSNDEVGDLADSFERMIAAVRYLKEHKT